MLIAVEFNNCNVFSLSARIHASFGFIRSVHTQKQTMGLPVRRIALLSTESFHVAGRVRTRPNEQSALPRLTKRQRIASADIKLQLIEHGNSQRRLSPPLFRNSSKKERAQTTWNNKNCFSLSRRERFLC